MWDHDKNIDSPQLLPYVQNPPTSNATNLPSSCDEDLADEADEPPDNQLIPCRTVSSPDGKFSKLEYPIYRHPSPKESLLTRALLTSPTLAPIDRVVPPSLERGMSASSVWSNTSSASTADLTSDAGMTSPSGANTPSSPPPPMYLSGIAGVLDGLKKPVFADPKPVEIVPDREDVVEGLGRKRCITFACGGSNISSQASDDNRSLMPKQSKEPVPPKKSSVLKFMCTQREQSDSPKFRSQRSSSPPPPKPILHREAENSARSNVGGAAPAAMPVEAPAKAPYVERQLYDVEGSAESWTNQPIDKSRLLWVDGMLRKEKEIRKLSEAVEEEEMQEEDEEGTLVADPDDEDDEVDEENEEVDDVDEDDDQDDEEHDSYDDGSGNETDNEEGFASDDESDDELFFGLHPPMVAARPACCRSPSPLTINLPGGGTSPRRIRSPTPELPDSTDFVCGTFDEDKALEQAYLSCLEERKRNKHKTTPQDIDPSFPTSDSEESENEGESRRKAKTTRDDSASDGRGPKLRASSKTHSRSPHGRVHSPVPANPSRSRHASPAPARRGRAHSLAPTKMGRRMQFQTGHNIVRTRSLPRNPEFGRRAGRTQRTTSISGSPRRMSTRPMVIRRGAMDIVKGLEKRRERRRFARNKDKEGSWKAGEGVERMRELGLEIFGKGKARQQAIWVLSV
jgi:hypothetical protein